MGVVRKKILLVDDEPDIVKTTSLALLVEGFEVITAQSAEIALDKIRIDSPDLFILDVMLPKMSGYELAGLLKHEDKYRQLPIILITALVQKNEEELINNGIVDFYLKKPFELEQLINKIKELLNKKG